MPGPGLREQPDPADRDRDCVAALVYVYDHAARQLAKRLTDTFHDHHEMSLASMHAHLDHDTCMEVTILRGKTEEVQHFAEHVIAERGLRHGRLVLVPTAAGGEAAGPMPRDHAHGHPRRGSHSG